MNILILSGKFGMGHNSVAKALEEEINIINSSINIETVDLLEYIYPLTHDLIYKSFNNMVNKYHELYNLLYKVSEKLEVDMKLSGSLINKKLDILFDEFNPDLVISTLPLCARTISFYKELRKCDVKLVTCVTDISKHVEWIAPNTDYYLVPAYEIKEHLILNKIPEDKISIVGIPVKQEFKEKVNKDEKEVHKTSNNRKNVLIMGGGLGLIPDIDNLIKSLLSYGGINITVITGKNKKIYNELNSKYRSIEVVGYTNKVHDYMHKADLIISKAGGITLFESIYTQTPMIVLKPFLEQEKFNAKYIVEKEIGHVIWKKNASISKEVIEILSDEVKLKRYSKNISDLRIEYNKMNVGNIMKKIVNGSVA